jgi:hypothetical protein
MYIFNYNTFHTYYTEPKNLLTDTTDCVSLYYFIGDKNKLKNSHPKCDYIIINGIKIYVSKSDSKSTCIANDGKKITEQTDVLLFSIPTMIDDKMFDFHYHFGIRTHTYIDILHLCTFKTPILYIANQLCWFAEYNKGGLSVTK